MLSAAVPRGENLPREQRQGGPGPSQRAAREGGRPCRREAAGWRVARRSAGDLPRVGCQATRGTLHR